MHTTSTPDQRPDQPAKPRPTRRSFLTTLAITASGVALNQTAIAVDPTWTETQPPFRIAGNLYYVGSRDLASYLIHTAEGNILINSNLTTSPAQIKAAIEKLGFRFEDTKILLISHAHYDHCAGSAEIKRQTGAAYMVMDADVPDIQSGGRTNFRFGSQKDMQYPSAKVDRVLRDGDTVRLGEARLIAHKTPGHTKGCTTWTMQAAESGRLLDVVIVGGPYVLDSYNLIDDPKYPQMAADFTQTFHTLQSLHCDIFLGAHGSYYQMLEKYRRLKADDPKTSAHPPAANPFIDPTGYRELIADAQQDFGRKLAKQRDKKRQLAKA